MRFLKNISLATRLYALVAAPDLLQFGTPLPEPVHAGLQAVNAMNVQIQLDETRGGKIGRKRRGRRRKDGRELRKGHRLRSTHKVERRTPHSGDLPKCARR
jgi:hypothetical protein